MTQYNAWEEERKRVVVSEREIGTIVSPSNQIMYAKAFNSLECKFEVQIHFLLEKLHVSEFSICPFFQFIHVVDNADCFAKSFFFSNFEFTT